MTEQVYTKYEPMTLKIFVSTAQETNVRLIITDSQQENTVLTNRARTIAGDDFFYVRLPLCRKYVTIHIYSDDDGTDNGIVYKGYRKLPLMKRLDVIDFDNTYNLNEFIRLIENFAYNAGVMRTNDPNDDNDYYVSKQGHFYIKYLPTIYDYETGAELTTPARISNDYPVIEVSQKYIRGFTVPMIVATLTHEFSHKWINVNPDDESEADINGLTIYLGLGYPRVEAAEAWCDIFSDSATDENMERIAIIKKFIDDFEENDIVISN